MKRTESAETNRIDGLHIVDGELTHYQRLLIEHNGAAWKAFVGLHPDVQKAILEAGIMYATERRINMPKALRRLSFERLRRGLSYGDVAKQVNSHCHKMLEDMTSAHMVRYLALRKAVGGAYTSTVDPVLLAEGGSDTKGDFRKRARCDENTFRGLESGRPEPIRPETQLVVESFFGMEFSALLKTHRA
jgi:hypothetical protein